MDEMTHDLKPVVRATYEIEIPGRVYLEVPTGYLLFRLESVDERSVKYVETGQTQLLKVAQTWGAMVGPYMFGTKDGD